MDFKGITWAGNIYDKFEAMCLEVEEVIYEDTVKYMESQAQKVGASVKKFYSEVMQDLIPPSCIDPVKVSAGDLPLNPYGHTDTYKKPKLSTLENKGELMKKETEVHNSYITSEQTSFSLRNDAKHQLPPVRVLVENTNSTACSKTNKRLGIHRRAIGIKRISQTSGPPKTSGPVHQEISGDRSSMVTRNLRSGFVDGSDDTNVTRPSQKCDSVGAKLENVSISDDSDEPLASEKKLSAESRRQEKDNSEGTSPVSGKVLSAESVRQKKDISECTSSVRQEKDHSEGTSSVSGKVLSAESVRQKKDISKCTSSFCDSLNKPVDTSDKSIDDGSFSRIYSEDVVESSCGEIMVSCEENFGLELIDNEEAVDELFEPVEESKFEDFCVFVEGDSTHPVSQRSEKQRSYKKKLQEALSLKFRPTRKQNHRYKDSDGKKNPDANIPDLATKPNHQTLPARDPFGSDWELI